MDSLSRILDRPWRVTAGRTPALAAALALGTALTSLTAGAAHAEAMQRAETSGRCQPPAPGAPIQVSRPYDPATHASFGDWQYCGDDGTWHVYLMRTDVAPQQPRRVAGSGGGGLVQ